MIDRLDGTENACDAGLLGGCCEVLELGTILGKLRTEKHLSQKQLAQKIGVEGSTVALYEQGERTPSIKVLIRLSRALGVSTDYLLGNDSERNDFIDASGLTQSQINSINAIIENYRESNKSDT